MVSDLRQKIGISLLLALAVLVGLAIYGDIRTLPAALARFQWHYAPAVLGLTLVNYTLRFVRWEYYLRRLDVRGLTRTTSLAIYISGFALLLTPGKVGEVAKSYFLRLTTGVPMARTAPMVMAERLVDGVAMALLCSLGLAVVPARETWAILGATLGGLLAFVILVQWRNGALWVLRWGERLPLAGRFAHSFHQFYESSADLLRPGPFLLSVGIGVIAWGMEALAFYLVLLGLGLPASLQLLQQALFIFPFATIVGALIMMPGGLGGAEASMAGLLQLLARTPETVAVAATLLIRFGTLWFGVTLGMIALWLNRRRFFGEEAASALPPADDWTRRCRADDASSANVQARVEP